jgi:hypothetical protein
LLALFGYRFGRHCFGGLPQERKHRQAVLKIPLACRHDAVGSRDSSHLGYGLPRLGEVLQNKQRESRIERAVGKRERFGKASLELRAGVGAPPHARRPRTLVQDRGL